MFKLISPLTTLWGFKAPDWRTGGCLCVGGQQRTRREVPQYHIQGQSILILLILLLPLLRGGCTGAPATPRPGAGSAPAPSATPRVTPHRRDASHLPPKRVPGQSRDGGSGRGTGREGALVS